MPQSEKNNQDRRKGGGHYGCVSWRGKGGGDANANDSFLMRRKALPESRPPRQYLHTCCCWCPARGATPQPAGPSSCSPTPTLIQQSKNLLRSPRIDSKEPFPPEPVFENLLRSPGIDSRPGLPVRDPYLSYRPARLHRLAASIPRIRFLGSWNVYKYGARKLQNKKGTEGDKAFYLNYDLD